MKGFEEGLSERLQDKFLAVSIARQVVPEPEWAKHIPFHCLVEDGPDWNHSKSRERVEYLADKQNRAIEDALLLYPETTDILWIDSHYLNQDSHSVYRLLGDYSLDNKKSVFGAAILSRDYRRIRKRILYYDIWATPEMKTRHFNGWKMPTGLQRVNGVGSVYVYPRWLWEKYRYSTPEPFPDAGCQHNWLCERSGLPIYLDWNATFWRTVRYSMKKRVRCSLGELHLKLSFNGFKS